MYDLDDVIDKDVILGKIKEEDIFERYLGIRPDFSQRFKNPLRKDDHPDCRFYIDKRGVIKFNDLARKGWNWDCFNVVQVLYNCNFKEALDIIAQDFNLSKKKFDSKLLENRKKLQISNLNKEIIIEVRVRGWMKYDLEYWNQYYLDVEDLQYHSVHPIEMAWMNQGYGKELIYNFKAKNKDYGYCYYFGKGVYKLYFPFRRRDQMKFCHNNSSILQGSHLLSLKGEDVIITKSYKDVICLSKFGIEAVAPMSETIIPTKKQISILRGRFNNVFVLYDNDRSGKMMAKKIRDTYDLPVLMFDKDHEKDFSDNLKRFGINYMNDLIEETKNILMI